MNPISPNSPVARWSCGTDISSLTRPIRSRARPAKPWISFPHPRDGPDLQLSALFRIALRSLSRNRLRTFLTMLGIIIGVAAVIAMLAVGQGARAAVESSIAGLGTNVITVYPLSRNQSGARME